ncbi:transcriptional regulator, AsnC family [Rhodomicrobium vannielii ATCC 17100]|uniref:Transcriptional regulator, AsnC family n=2 Tax=Rhodomicrobium vannielii TaxID=1069 RepID=E3I0W6_RHOVT|nr:transcriptional regulator, AsnC family [Rhodomicrobium vannielii ATCC 17100]
MQIIAVDLTSLKEASCAKRSKKLTKCRRPLAKCQIMPLDETNRRLIALLRENARMPVATLAAILGLSRATVQNRIDRLVHDGVITGFTVALRREAEPDAVCAIMLIQVEGEKTEHIYKALRGFPEAVAIHTTNGRWDFVVELRTPDLETFDRVLRRIRELKGISSSETSLLLSSNRR